MYITTYSSLLQIRAFSLELSCSRTMGCRRRHLIYEKSRQRVAELKFMQQIRAMYRDFAVETTTTDRADVGRDRLA
jgi:hypothetical protein